MIARAIAEAALAAHGDGPNADGYGEPVDSAIALTMRFGRADFIGLALAAGAGAGLGNHQLDALRGIIGDGGDGIVSGAELFGLIEPLLPALGRVHPREGQIHMLRLMLAALDQADIDTSSRLILDALCPEEQSS